MDGVNDTVWLVRYPSLVIAASSSHGDLRQRSVVGLLLVPLAAFTAYAGFLLVSLASLGISRADVWGLAVISLALFVFGPIEVVLVSVLLAAVSFVLTGNGLYRFPWGAARLLAAALSVVFGTAALVALLHGQEAKALEAIVFCGGLGALLYLTRRAPLRRSRLLAP